MKIIKKKKKDKINGIDVMKPYLYLNNNNKNIDNNNDDDNDDDEEQKQGEEDVNNNTPVIEYYNKETEWSTEQWKKEKELEKKAPTKKKKWNNKKKDDGDDSDGGGKKLRINENNLKEDDQYDTQQRQQHDRYEKEGWLEMPSFLTSNYYLPRVVKFYLPWCGHCKHYKPEYIQLAKDTTRAFALASASSSSIPSASAASSSASPCPKIEFYAVSCVPYRPICKEMGVTRYPSLQIFKANSNIGTTVNKHDLNVTFIANHLGVQLPQNWTKMIMIEQEEEDDNDNDEDTSMQQRKDEDEEEAARMVVGIRENKSSRWTDSIDKKELYSDAFLSFQFVLLQGVYMENGPLSQKRQNALLTFIDVLHQSLLPVLDSYYWSDMKNLLVDLRNNYNLIIKGDEYLEAIVSQHSSTEGEKKSWSKYCDHGNPGDGYTCGLWELFHIVTVGVAESRGYERDHERDGLMVRVTPMNAADAIRNFIDEFFACDVCRTNFIQMYDDCQFHRCTRLKSDVATTKLKSDNKNNNNNNDSWWHELALWLWETHNDVNVRLMKEGFERAGLTKYSSLTKKLDEESVKWPLKSHCPNCWINHDNDGNNTPLLSSSSWNSDVVYEYLKDTYWPSEEELKAVVASGAVETHLPKPKSASAIGYDTDGSGEGQGEVLDKMILLNHQSDIIMANHAATNDDNKKFDKRNGVIAETKGMAFVVAVVVNAAMTISPSFLLLLFLVLLFVIPIRMERKKVKRTGLHKKIDSMNNMVQMV